VYQGDIRAVRSVISVTFSNYYYNNTTMSETQTPAQKAQRNAKPIAPDVAGLIEKSRSVILATVDAEGNPNSSYAPFARIGNKLYVLVSFMSRHTKNLRDMKKASVMFIDDESETKQIYARVRLTVDMLTAQIERGTPVWETGTQQLKSRHGKVVEVLEGMEDFIMIELTPVKGAYVNGFGSAYFVDENLEITEHRNDVGHRVAADKK
jgi:putative heme iron utilization protein